MSTYLRRFGGGLVGLVLLGLVACQQAVPGGMGSERGAASQAASSVPASRGPTIVATATGGSHQVVINWTSLAGSTSYNVYRFHTNVNESATWLTNVGAQTLTYTDTTGDVGVSYSYMIQAINDHTVWGFSNLPAAVSLP